MLRAVLHSIVLFAFALHMYYILWQRLDHQSGVLFYANLAIRTSLVLVIIYLIFGAYRKFKTMLATARWLDMLIDKEDDLYQNVLELGEKYGHDNPITLALSSQALERLKSNQYKLPPIFKANQWLLILSLFIGLAAIWAVDYQNFRASAKQFYTNKAETIRYKETIELSPGNLRIGKNSQVLIEVKNPEHRLEHKLFYRTESNWRELAMTDYSYLFERLDNSIEYYVENSVAKSDVYKIEVLDEPYVKNWLIRYEYPAYTGLAATADSSSYGNIIAYAGTRIKLGITSNVPAKEAVMNLSNGQRIKLTALDKQNFIGQFTVNQSQTWYLELTDELGRKSRPEEKTIQILPDNAPQIRVLFPAKDVTLNQDMLLPLIVSADDDFGLQDCNLKYFVNDSNASTISIQSTISGKLFTKDWVFDMKSLNLMPGDVVTYWFEIYDNSPGHQKAETARFRARFPSIEEIFREIEARERSTVEELENIGDRSRELQQDFEEMRRELLREDNPNWQQQQQLQQIIEQQENLSEQVDQINENYQELVERMQMNSTLSQDMVQKMQRIQELMAEINNESLQEALQRMNEAMENIRPEDLRRAMENFRFSMEDFAQKIQQTIDLLESVKKEQAVQKALQISEEMQRMQEDLLQRTNESNQDNQRLASDQENIEQKYDNLQQELANLEQMLDPDKDRNALQQLRELQREMRQSDPQPNMQESRQSLNQNNRSSAAQAQSEALQKMRTFTRRLQQMRESMGAGSQQEVKQAMETAVREMLIFSRNHEELSTRYQNDPYQIVQDLISTYEGIQLSLNKLYSKPQVMMFLTPKFYIDLSDTFNAYREFFVNISEMQYTRTPELLSRIQRGINLVTYDLIQSMQNQGSGSGSGSGMQSLMQMLQQMSQEQMAMNMLTQQLMQQMQANGGGMDAAMQQQMQRLASDQQRLADNLKRALQNNPQAQQQGNSLQQIIEEAEAVSRQLRGGRLDQEILNRQERIISRMLDAQRSLNQREQSRERRAEASTRQDWGDQVSPQDFESLRRRAILDESYRSYPAEYQQFIIEYLKRINSGGGQ